MRYRFTQLRRRTMLKLLPAALLAACGLVDIARAAPNPNPAPDPEPKTRDPKFDDLQDRLEAGLKARRPIEFEFLAAVVDQAAEGILPLSLIDSTFFWARRKPKNLVQYFEQALRFRAKKLNIKFEAPTTLVGVQ